MLRAALIALLALSPTLISAAPTPEVVTPSSASMDAFLMKVKQAVEGHQWLALLDLCDPAHKKEQLGVMGMGAAQYLAEQLGLNHVKNHLKKKGPLLTEADLNTIKGITIEQKMKTDMWIEVKGQVILNSGEILKLNLLLTEEKGEIYLTGGVG